MDGNQFKDLTEVYKSVYQSQEDLQELNVTGGRVGFEIGRGKRGITAGVDTDKGSVDVGIGKQKVGGSTDPKDAIDSAISKLGDAHVGGKAGSDTRAAKPTPERSVPYASVRANFSGSTGTKPQTPTKPRVEDPVKPIVKTSRPDGKKVTSDGDRTMPDRKPMDMGKREDTMSDVDAYNLVLEYLLDEGFASTEDAADKIILNMSESWFEDIMERNRYEKETGKDYKTGKEVKKGGTMGGDDTQSKVMRHMHKVMGAGRMGAGGAIQERGKKKEKGKKPPAAGEYGGPASPAQKVAKRRADVQKAKDMMHSARD